jgi:hypothetical protein
MVPALAAHKNKSRLQAYTLKCRPRWCSGYRAYHWTQVSRVQTSPEADLYLRAIKIRSTSSRGEAKPSAPCRKILRHVKRSLRSMKEILSRQNEQSSGWFDKHKNKGFIFITLVDLLYWLCSYKIYDTAYVRVSLQLNALWRTVKHDFRGFSSQKKVLDAEERARTMTIGSK